MIRRPICPGCGNSFSGYCEVCGARRRRARLRQIIDGIYAEDAPIKVAPMVPDLVLQVLDEMREGGR